MRRRKSKQASAGMLRGSTPFREDSGRASQLWLLREVDANVAVPWRPDIARVATCAGAARVARAQKWCELCTRAVEPQERNELGDALRILRGGRPLSHRGVPARVRAAPRVARPVATRSRSCRACAPPRASSGEQLPVRRHTQTLSPSLFLGSEFRFTSTRRDLDPRAIYQSVATATRAGAHPHARARDGGGVRRGGGEEGAESTRHGLIPVARPCACAV